MDLLEKIKTLEWYEQVTPDEVEFRTEKLPRRCVDFDRFLNRPTFYKHFANSKEYDNASDILLKNENVVPIHGSSVISGGTEGFSADIAWTDIRLYQSFDVMTLQGRENEKMYQELAKIGYPVVHNEIYDGRLLIIKECSNFGRHWYDGYIQLLPDKDPADWLRNAGIDDEGYFYEVSCFADLPGGPTFAGALDEYPDKYFVGFDTMHGFTESMTKADVISALKECSDQLSG